MASTAGLENGDTEVTLTFKEQLIRRMHRSQWQLLYWQRTLIQTSHGKHTEGRAQERKQMRNVSLSTVDGDSFPFLIWMQKYTEHCQPREFTHSLPSRTLRHCQRGTDISTRLTSVSSTPGSWADSCEARPLLNHRLSVAQIPEPKTVLPFDWAKTKGHKNTPTRQSIPRSVKYFPEDDNRS